MAVIGLDFTALLTGCRMYTKMFCARTITAPLSERKLCVLFKNSRESHHSTYFIKESLSNTSSVFSLCYHVSIFMTHIKILCTQVCVC